MQIFSTKTMGYKQIWEKSWILYQHNFFRVWWLTLSVAVLIYFLNHLPVHIKPSELIIAISALSISLILFLTKALTNNLMLHQFYSAAIHEPKTWKQSIHEVGKKYFRLVLVSFIVSIFILMGLLVLILPGIFLYVLFIFVQLYVLFDNKKIFAAIQASAKLVWDFWWRTFLVILPVLLISLLTGIFVFFVPEKYVHVAQTCSLLLGSIVIPLFYCVLLVQFHDLQVRKKLLPH